MMDEFAIKKETFRAIVLFAETIVAMTVLTDKQDRREYTNENCKTVGAICGDAIKIFK